MRNVPGNQPGRPCPCCPVHFLGNCPLFHAELIKEKKWETLGPVGKMLAVPDFEAEGQS